MVAGVQLLICVDALEKAIEVVSNDSDHSFMSIQVTEISSAPGAHEFRLAFMARLVTLTLLGSGPHVHKAVPLLKFARQGPNLTRRKSEVHFTTTNALG